MAAELPEAVARMAGRGDDWAAWVDALPTMRDALLTEWQLRPDGAAMSGYCSLVLPVRDRDDAPAVLKIGFPDAESEHEHLALRHWGGRSAVALRRADPRRRALLLERLQQRTLADVPVREACEVVGRLYGELHVPAPPPLRRLSDELRRWEAQLAALPADAGVPRRLVEQARALDRDLAADPGPAVLLHTDLHYDNVLAASSLAPQASLAASSLAPQASLAGPPRSPWLAIDPKPLAGDPHYELAPMLWNRWAELAGDVRSGVRQRFFALVDAAGLDADRARDYVIARMIHNVAWRLADPPGTQRRTPTADYLTMCVAVAKAVQD